MTESWCLRYRYARRLEGFGWFCATWVTLARELAYGPIRSEQLGDTMRKLLA